MCSLAWSRCILQPGENLAPPVDKSLRYERPCLQTTSGARPRRPLGDLGACVCLSVRASQARSAPPKEGFDKSRRSPCLFIPFNLHPASQDSRTTLKNPINGPALGTKWTAEHPSNFCSDFTYWGISQLTAYLTNISF